FAAGDVYGTAYAGGQEGLGTIFAPVDRNQPVEKHEFTRGGAAGYYPIGDLASSQSVDGIWSMYGTTSAGGTGGRGTVYQLVERFGGYNIDWTISVVHSFHGSDGGFPWGGVILDPAGNLYGTASWGGCDLSRRCTHRRRAADGRSVTETTMRTMEVVMLQ